MENRRFLTTRTGFFRLLLPLVIGSLACSLVSSPAEKLTTEEVNVLPTVSQITIMPEPKSTDTPLPTSTSPLPTNTLLPPTNTPTDIPTNTLTDSPTASPTSEPIFSWIPEVAYKSQSAGYFANLEIDNQDKLHLGFFQDTNDMVWWMHSQNKSWADPEQVTGGLGRGFHVSMALDSNDNPHFAYHSLDTKKQEPFLFYKYWKGSSWTNVFKNAEYRVFNTDISLALGPDDQPHFLFMEDYGNNLIYAQFGSNGYENQVIGQPNPDVHSLPLIVDPFGNPHIAYQSKDQGLVYATLQDGNWVWEVVDPNPGAGLYADITLDDDSQVYIVFYDQSESNLKYAIQSEAGWDVQVVDAQGNVGQFPSIVVDTAGNIHISYYDAGKTNLKYAYGASGEWAIDTVDDSGSVGEYTSIALDSQGLPFIAYFDRDNEDLKLARAMPLSP